MMKHILLFVFLFIPQYLIKAQVPVHISNYNHIHYRGGVQNWGIHFSQLNRTLYVANDKGLLSYDGNDWHLLSDAEVSTVRAVCSVGKKVYIAGDNCIGYWEHKSNGEVIYVSLFEQIKKLGLQGETFWSIGTLGEKLYFHSFGNILCYDGKVMHKVVSNECCISLFQSGKRLFTQKCDGGLFEIIGDTLHKCFTHPIIENKEIRFMFQVSKEEHFIIGTADGYIYLWNGSDLILLEQLINEKGGAVRIDCGSLWKNKQLAIGTIGDGVYLLDIVTKKCLHLPVVGLQDLNVHGICFSSENLLWLSLDNGISSMLFSPAMYLWKTHVDIGTFFDAAYFKDKIYVASNQGIFLYGNQDGKMQPGIYPLQFCALKDELLCGTTSETFRLNTQSGAFEPLCPINGVRQFEYMASHGEEYMFLRAYSGISTLKYDGARWRYYSSVMGTEDYSFIMPENLYTVWAIHPSKGIFRLRLNETLTKVEENEHFFEIEGYGNFNRVSLFKLEDKILFATPLGIYLYNVVTRKFQKQERLSKEVVDLEKIQAIKSAFGNKIWVITDDELFMYKVTDFSAKLILHQPLVGNELMFYDKHFNMKSVNDSLTFVSTCKGTMVMDTRQMINFNDSVNLSLVSCSYMKKGGELVKVTLQQGEIILPSKATNIRIKMATGVQEVQDFISYRISDIHTEWSPWQKSGEIYFTNLPSGHYKLEIRDSYQNMLVIPVSVLPPFYLRTWMFVLYILTLIIATVIVMMTINERRRRILLLRYKAEQKRNEEERRLRAYEQLQEKVKNQESELKIRMRYLTQKQELLDDIATEVEVQKKELGERYPQKFYTRLMRIIQKGVTEEDKLLSFENYFVEVHYEFMLRIQKLHSDLSPSELKFCCLLRANLSTKEIATIMGIALRSVELKKYRLKRKLHLDQDTNLASYILSI